MTEERSAKRDSLPGVVLDILHKLYYYLLMRSGPTPFEAFLPFGLAAGVVLLLGSAASKLMYMSDMNKVYEQQRKELAQNPYTFTVSEPRNQPSGRVIATWDSDSDSYRLRRDERGNVSLSDPYEPSAIIGRESAPVAPCSALKLDVYETHSFNQEGHHYKLLLTNLGNAAVCEVSE